VATAPTLFISDLHLSRERPELVEAFHALIAGPARGAAALYVPGDIFDAWLGDDQLREPLAAGVAGAFARLAASGTPIYLQRGNRDFLLGERFARASGATLLADAVVHDVQGTPTLIMHGDLLCTDDVDYQRFRAYWQDPTHRRRLLALPYFVRRGIAAFFRATSKRATASKLIHGHTHRPARHELTVDGRACERYVLADWYTTASYLRVDREGVTPAGYSPGRAA
jgi:UDP-2,3-diacylglucosamine hydrolase